MDSTSVLNRLHQLLSAAASGVPIYRSHAPAGDTLPAKLFVLRLRNSPAAQQWGSQRDIVHHVRVLCAAVNPWDADQLAQIVNTALPKTEFQVQGVIVEQTTGAHTEKHVAVHTL